MLLYRSASVLNSTKLSLPPTLFSYSRSLLSKPSISFPSSRSPVQVHVFCRGGGSRGFAAGTNSAAAFSCEKRGGDTFLADDSVSWTSLGLSDRISRALLNTGFERPSLVQAGSIPAILSGKDVVVAAETGSGKTHAYLVPLVSRICDKQDDSEDSASQQGSSSSGRLSVILCPNALLCEQVVRMANSLCDENGEPLVRIVSLCGRQGWPVSQPDIIVSTPAALLNNMETKRNRSQFYRNVKYVVFDEADMLLSGGFLNKVIHLINMFRFDEKQLSRANNSISKVPMSSSTDLPEELGLEDDKTIQDDSVSEEEQEEEEVLEDTTAIEGSEEEVQAGSAERKDWRRIRKIYERSKQYIFVAATLPVNGKKTAGAMLKHMFPDANWISGNYLHCHNPRLKHKWIEVTVDTQIDALMEAVKSKSPDSSSGISRTMVFANTVDAVEAVAKILESAEIECYRYHKEVPLEERGKALADFRDIGGIFVCTDAASRGVDISNVSHVIQADFANSAVDFLHRVGRTARAGQYGVVTSLYTEANRDLVDAIIEAKKLGHPVETAFSRKRSFRKKLKKRGNVL